MYYMCEIRREMNVKFSEWKELHLEVVKYARIRI